VLTSLIYRERFEYAQDDFTLDEAALKNYFKCTDKEVEIVNVKIPLISYSFLTISMLMAVGRSIPMSLPVQWRYCPIVT
jgi:hypothetical protein